MLDKFVVGSRWFRRDYEFEVVTNNGQTAEYLKVDPDGMLNTFVGGIIDDAETQMRIHSNVIADKNLKLKESMGLQTKKGKKAGTSSISNVTNHFFTLGVLAKHGLLEIRVIPSTVSDEDEWYENITGLTVSKVKEGYTYNPNKDTYATEMHISLPQEIVSDRIVFPNPPVEKNNMVTDYNTEWCRELVHRGFRVGRDHDVKRIRKNIPKEYLEYFEEGFNT